VEYLFAAPGVGSSAANAAPRGDGRGRAASRAWFHCRPAACLIVVWSRSSSRC